MAEAVRFELTEELPLRQFSRLLHSTALPRLRNKRGAHCASDAFYPQRLSVPRSYLSPANWHTKLKHRPPASCYAERMVLEKSVVAP